MTTDNQAVEAIKQAAYLYGPYSAEMSTAIAAALAAERQAERERALEDAGAWVDARRNAFVAEHGYTDPDTGALEFGRGQHAEEKAEYAGELEEIAEGIRALKAKEEGK